MEASELRERLDSVWQRMLGREWDEPATNERYFAVIQEAHSRPELRSLFPYTSLTRLCFSRSSEHPYTDLPCVWFGSIGYLVQASAVPDEPVPLLLDLTDSEQAAVDALVHGLPVDRTAWVGPGPTPPR